MLIMLLWCVKMTCETLRLLLDLARRQQLPYKIQAMHRGEKINYTEDRAVLHMVGAGGPVPSTTTRLAIQSLMTLER